LAILILVGAGDSIKLTKNVPPEWDAQLPSSRNYFLAAFLFFLFTSTASSLRYFPGFFSIVRMVRVATLMRSFVPVTGSITILLVTFGLKVLFVWRLE
jgi:hypothetical protein